MKSGLAQEFAIGRRQTHGFRCCGATILCTLGSLKGTRYPHLVAPTTAFDALGAWAWPIRLLRVCAASLVGLALALAGHTLAGGEMSSIPVILADLAVVATAGYLLSGRRLTLGQIVGLLLIAQVVVHVGCLVGASTPSLSAAMIVGHLIATAITAAVLSGGEQFAWALVERLGLRVIPLLSTTSLPAVRRIGQNPAYEDSHPPAFMFAGGTGLRGPPVGPT